MPTGRSRPLGGRGHAAKGFFQAAGSNDQEQADPTGANYKSAGRELGTKSTFRRLHFEGFLSYVDSTSPSIT